MLYEFVNVAPEFCLISMITVYGRSNKHIEEDSWSWVPNSSGSNEGIKMPEVNIQVYRNRHKIQCFEFVW